ncbi:hypothetical protein HMPREF1141_2762 [Clostridium sp. MSTE9]|nr:hypothetical protein HMPREF1141_2762 [Clostridium sp. MSTE9]
MYPYALCCTAVILRAFFVKEQRQGRVYNLRKGERRVLNLNLE